MLFKGRVLLVITFFVAIGCGLKIGEKYKPERKVEFKAQDCLKNTSLTIRAYMDHQLSNKQIINFTQCLQESFSSFEQKTHDKESESYRMSVLRDFLQEHFLGRPISDPFFVSIQNMKRSLIGGQPDIMTRDELKHFINMIPKVAEVAVRLNPHIPIYGRQLDAKLQEEVGNSKVDQATKELQWAANELALILQQSGQPMYFSELEVFLEQFRLSLQWDQLFNRTSRISKWMDLVQPLKKVFGGGGETKVTSVEWKPGLVGMANAYGSWLKYSYHVKGLSLLTDQSMKRLNLFINEIIDWSRVAVNSQSENIIEFKYFENISDAMEALNLLPKGIRSVSLKNMIEPVVSRILGDPTLDISAKVGEGGVTAATIFQAAYEFHTWSRSQVQINKLYKGTPPFISDNIGGQMVQIFKEITEENTSHSFNLRQLLSIRPLYREGNPKKVYLASSEQRSMSGSHHSQYDLTLKNLYRLGVRLVVRGYSKDKTNYTKLFKTLGFPIIEKSNCYTLSVDEDCVQQLLSPFAGLTEVELQMLINDLGNLAYDIKVIKPDVISSVAGRIFLEAKTFTYMASGLQFIGNKTIEDRIFDKEGLEIFGFMISNAKTTKAVYKSLRDRCTRGPLDVFNQEKVDRECALSELRAAIIENIDHMPGLKNYISNLDHQNWDLYQELLERGSMANNKTTWMEYSNLGVMVMLLHYTEASYTRYDEDQDDRISDIEALQAFPVFKGFMEKILIKKGYSFLGAKKLYQYLIEVRGVPRTTSEFITLLYTYYYKRPILGLLDDLGGRISSLFGEGNKPEPDFYLNRSELLRVFVVIGEAKSTSTPSI